jgi:hypothetical protein
MANRRPRKRAAPNDRGSRGDHRVAPLGRKAKRPHGESDAHAELNVMREVVAILVQAITDLAAVLPKDKYAARQVIRVEGALARMRDVLADRQRRWSTEEE